VVLKARQLGLSWLALAYYLHRILFRPAYTLLIFSQRETEAIDLLDFRLKGMYERLPRWMQPGKATVDGKLDWQLPNGSAAKAFSTTGGRSYTASGVLVDEADFIPDLDRLLNAVKPTTDAGGQLMLISTVDKSNPASPFKQIYRGAVSGETDWLPIFLPWSARPGRDAVWYEAQRTDIVARTGAEDDLHQEYPATDTEALSPRSLDKRIPAVWIEECYQPRKPLTRHDGPALPGLEVYRAPEAARLYVIGGDPAEGNPTSDPSAATLLDMYSGEECACLTGRIEPATFASYLDLLGIWYNKAQVMVERNNHGHSVLQWFKEHSRLRLLDGYDDKAGWLNNSLGKSKLYDEGAKMFRDRATILHSAETYYQLASIEGATLLAPSGEHDDRADSYVLAHVGRQHKPSAPAKVQTPRVLR